MGLLCCPNFYVTWYHFRSLVLCRSLCCPNFSVTWSHFDPFCMGLHVVRVSMSLGITSILCRSICCPIFLSLDLTAVLYGSLCCPSFYVTWSHFRSVWVSMLSKVLCHLVAHIITHPPPCNTAQVITTLGDMTYYISDLSHMQN